ncbi:MAG: hypothetical protein L6Q57_04850 [Alphaproteobacteria bacterium]|nr:hypothetical protein [Alphaproteobacteria bacterium]
MSVRTLFNTIRRWALPTPGEDFSKICRMAETGQPQLAAWRFVKFHERYHGRYDSFGYIVGEFDFWHGFDYEAHGVDPVIGYDRMDALLPTLSAKSCWDNDFRNRFNGFIATHNIRIIKPAVMDGKVVCL